MPEDSEIVIQVAQAMFKEVHGYHPDLNWDNAYQSHKDLYLKFARIAYRELHSYFCDPECVKDEDLYGAGEGFN